MPKNSTEKLNELIDHIESEQAKRDIAIVVPESNALVSTIEDLSIEEKNKLVTNNKRLIEITKERREQVKIALVDNPLVHATDLAKIHNVSTTTIYNDFKVIGKQAKRFMRDPDIYIGKVITEFDSSIKRAEKVYEKECWLTDMNGGSFLSGDLRLRALKVQNDFRKDKIDFLFKIGGIKTTPVETKNKIEISFKPMKVIETEEKCSEDTSKKIDIEGISLY